MARKFKRALMFLSVGVDCSLFYEFVMTRNETKLSRRVTRAESERNQLELFYKSLENPRFV